MQPAAVEATSPRRLPAAWVGPGLAALCIAISVGGFVLAVGPGGRPLGGLVSDNVLSNAVNGVVIGLLGGVLTAMRRSNRVGWLVLAVAWSNGLCILGEGWALASYAVDLPGRALFAWLGAWPWGPGLAVAATLLPLWYPSGRTGSRFAHRLAVVALVACAGLGVALALLDGTFDSSVPGHRLGANPISRGQLQPVWVGLAIVSAVLVLVIALLAWGHTVVRMLRAQSPEREQLAWLLAVVVVPALVAGILAPAWLNLIIDTLSLVGLAIGIVAHQMFDIKPVLRSGLLYAALTGLAVAAYFIVVALIGRLTPRGVVPSLFAAATVALVVLPAHRLLQRWVGWLVYGDRGDPVRALSRVGAGLRSLDSGTDLTAMAQAVADAVRSPFVEVRGQDDAVLASVGAVEPDHPIHEVVLDHAGARLGRMLVAGRTARNKLSSRDVRLVEVISAPVAVAVRAAQLAEELGASRSRVIAVRESERRRLRNDLHDGLGPSLSGVSLGLEAALQAPEGDPERVREILRVLHTEVDRLVAEVRSLIEDLGPPGLEAGDLGSALTAHAASVSALTGLDVEVHAECVPGLPASLEVALHRVATEALTNVVRHASATRVRIELARHDSHVWLSVVDDGTGVGGAEPGVGLSSMRERAESLGGRLVVRPGEQRGTVITADIPLTAGVPSDGEGDDG